MRRVQEWSFVSIIMEFRRNIWPEKIMDFEQLIENFYFDCIDDLDLDPY
jgi:hypothetical protein